jgi:hypothetical protein
MSIDSRATLHASAERCPGRRFLGRGENAAAVVRWSGSERALRAMQSSTRPDACSPACSRVARAWRVRPRRERRELRSTRTTRAKRRNRRGFSLHENFREMTRNPPFFSLEFRITRVRFRQRAFEKVQKRPRFHRSIARPGLACGTRRKRLAGSTALPSLAAPFSPPPTSPPARR